MAVELLTVVTHPLNPSQRLPPDRHFTEITVSHRMEVVKEQIDLLAQKADFFIEHGLLGIGAILMALRSSPCVSTKNPAPDRVSSLAAFRTGGTHPPAERFTFASMCEFGPLWLDDFGTGMANFSALSEVRYDYIKIARELFVMLRQSPEGRTLFSQLLHLMNRYRRGVIVEGVETPEEWRDVQNSPAFAAQGWFLPPGTDRNAEYGGLAL